MSGTNLQSQPCNTYLLSSPLPTGIAGDCGSLRTDESTLSSQYDRWLRPRPNLQWKNVENQTFIDQSKFNSGSLEEDEDGSDDEDDEDEEEEEIDSSDDMSDAEGSERENEDEACHVEEETKSRQHSTNNDLGGGVLRDKEVLGTALASDATLPASACEETPNRSRENASCGSVDQEDDVIALFLGVMDDRDLYRDSIARLRQFFKTATLEDLKEGAGELEESRVVLEDRNFSSKSFRPYPRAMTPKQLYNALGKRRYPSMDPSKLKNAIPRSWTKSENCEVERRTLYISNPNEWSAIVLAATASPTQAPALFDFIDQYLKFETSINVDPNVGLSFPFEILKSFHTSDIFQPYLARLTLYFQLPFYTFRARQYTDTRQDHEGNPLRKSFELPCMQLPGMSGRLSKSCGWICESQVSVLVSVIDVQGWTAYAFEDTYYKTRESLLELDIFCSKPGFYFPDALTAGNLDSTRFLEPREYFLRVLQHRINQAYREWRAVVDNIEEVVKRPSRIFNSSSSPIDRRYSKRDERMLLQQRYSDWISDMIAIISDQSGQLSETLTAWDEFEKRCPKYFPEEIRSLLETSIGHVFSKIRILKDKLDSLSKEICNDQSTLGAQLAVENTGTAKFVRVLNVICFLMMPMALNIALFSTQPGVLPFQMTFIAFVTSFFALALIVCMVWVILSQWDALVVLICYTLKNLDSAFQGPSGGETKSEYVEDQASETRAMSTGVDGGSNRMDAAPSRPTRTIWRHLNIHLPVRRGQVVAPEESHELADLETVVCV
ncbi:hypothetical protein N8I77_011504 [Diaporthe amygdali]|uniref:Uncharacterized protein n=1 Tax=Phomopsis amygdali TaxID=1214568 RepID=A0AAD9W099_PHOAM|nr:hypothetical protein N8I77_011504 [Diaporthe amygdali]